MKHTGHIVLSLIACLFVWQVGSLHAESLETREHEMKAAYIYHILKFVELPERPKAENQDEELKSICVGVSDKDVLMIFQNVIGHKEILQRKERYRIEVKYVDIKQLADDTQKPRPDVLFIRETTKYDPLDLLGDSIKYGILTVGETEGFLESRGIVNFLIVKNKLKFEINAGIAEKSGIKIRSQLLKLAGKVIGK